MIHKILVVLKRGMQVMMSVMTGLSSHLTTSGVSCPARRVFVWFVSSYSCCINCCIRNREEVGRCRCTVSSKLPREVLVLVLSILFLFVTTRQALWRNRLSLLLPWLDALLSLFRSRIRGREPFLKRIPSTSDFGWKKQSLQSSFRHWQEVVFLFSSCWWFRKAAATLDYFPLEFFLSVCDASISLILRIDIKKQYTVMVVISFTRLSSTLLKLHHSYRHLNEN